MVRTNPFVVDESNSKVTDNLVEFFVFGKPVPKSRPKIGINRRVCNPCKKLQKDFQSAVKDVVGEFTFGAVDLEIELKFFINRKTGLLTTPPDVDNLAKFVLDSMTNLCTDDSQVTKLTISKHRSVVEEHGPLGGTHVKVSKRVIEMT